MYQIHNCSPQAKELIKADASVELPEDNRPLLEARTRASKYPFRKMKVGHCFVIPYTEINEKSLSSLKKSVSTNNKLLRIFCKIIRHNDEQLIEVARIA